MALLTGGIAKIIQGATKSIMYPLALVRSVLTPATNEWEPGARKDTTYDCSGFISDYRESRIDGVVIQVGDRQALIVANSLTVVPVPGDKLTGQGETYDVINVGRDPASATYSLQLRR